MKGTFTCIDTDHFEVRETRQTEGDDTISEYGVRVRRIK